MYSKDIWDLWLKEELKNYTTSLTGKKEYKKKGYLHLNERFWLPDNINELENIIKNNLYTFDDVTNRNEFYSFSPFLKILTKTPRYRYQFEEGHYDLKTKIRPICYAAHKDSLIMSYYSFALTKRYEEYIKQEKFDEVVLAYRTDLDKCNIQFAKEVFDKVKFKNECSAIALDIKGYFDHIDHILLLEKWQKVIGSKLPKDQFKLFNVLTKYSYINQGILLKKYKGPKKRGEKLPFSLMEIIPGKNIREKFLQLKKDQLIVHTNKPNKKTNRFCGIPQGSPISALLSNIYLIDFDAELKQKSITEDFEYNRYCDDILIICDTKRASEIMNFIIEKISNYFLTIQPDKVDLIDFSKNSKNKIRSFRRPRKTIKHVGEKNKVIISDKPAITNSYNEEKLYKPLQYLGFEYNGKNITIRPGSLSRYFRKLNYRLERTVIMAHSPNTKSDKIFLKQIYEKYTHLGTRNFLTYAFKAAKDFYEDSAGIKKQGLNSPAIKKQVQNHMSLLQFELENKNEKWFSHKLKGKKKVTPKII